MWNSLFLNPAAVHTQYVHRPVEINVHAGCLFWFYLAMQQWSRSVIITQPHLNKSKRPC